MMKGIKFYLFLLSGLLLAAGCRQSSDVVSSSFLSKRKYRTGWHSDLFGAREAAPREKSPASDSEEPQTTQPRPRNQPGAREALSIIPAPRRGPVLQPSASENDAAFESVKKPSMLSRVKKKAQPPPWLQKVVAATEEDPYAERMEMMGIISLGLAGAVVTFAWIIPLLNILLCLAGIVFGIIAFAGGETLNGALGIAANFLLLIWSVIWTFLILSPLFLV